MKQTYATEWRPGRRSLLGAGIALAGAAARPVWAQGAVNLNFAVWGNRAEEEAFRRLIAGYTAQHPNVSIRLELNGSSAQLYQQVDTRLAGRQAPDLIRIQYQQVGRYAKAGAIVDLSGQLDAGMDSQFAPALWKAATYRGKSFAIPHHTDTLAVYCNMEMFQRIGVELPSRLEDSWRWEEFIRIARLLKEKAEAPFGFACAWQNTAAYRFLPFLYQHGGRLLDADLRQPQLSSREGIETLAWTQSWFIEKLVPPTTSIKSNEQTQNLFANGTIGMMVHGDWQIPFLQEAMTRAEWRVTYMPRDLSMASDLGGNCLAVTRDSKNRDVAIDFLRFATTEANMRDFCLAGGFLPVRKSLMEGTLDYPLRPDAMKVFVEQSRTIPDHLAATVTLPDFSRINAKLAEQLDLTFTSGQTPKVAAENVDSTIRSVLKD
ncbi:lactose-binding protein precursor [Roseomonas sp. TAS13]|nr:sugar ABC transporter substrate-binding protein [Roseomonas sp. TAS13]USQ73844.1 sugar ABC transporter substrate-binding protein [Roseomonas mucosa]GAV34581.1 lactose-binding protein precursor [Roseomonas sp. TAS13]